MNHPFFSSILLVAVVSLSSPAWAIRPFVTDDARVVGEGLLQLESWVQVDKGALAHWILPAFGPTPWLELSAGGLHGTAGTPRRYSLSGPLLQGKMLLHEARDGGSPGLALVLGSLFTHGTGPFSENPSSGFGYLASTASFRDEAILIHVNAGLGYGDESFTATGGIGTQLRMIGAYNAVAEIVRGDAYSRATDGAVQCGGRLLVNESVQLDATVGTGLWGDNQRPTWATVGIRLVSGRVW